MVSLEGPEGAWPPRPSRSVWTLKDPWRDLKHRMSHWACPRKSGGGPEGSDQGQASEEKGQESGRESCSGGPGDVGCLSGRYADSGGEVGRLGGDLGQRRQRRWILEQKRWCMSFRLRSVELNKGGQTLLLPVP